ncbi:MAG: hypothetical protein DLM68_00825 [Hyphomicrobiales bacterium]|nr:MAG: hypothetical protein DLM68_00825 [Hyphomicrobiales bacterium]
MCTGPDLIALIDRISFSMIHQRMTVFGRKSASAKTGDLRLKPRCMSAHCVQEVSHRGQQSERFI